MDFRGPRFGDELGQSAARKETFIRSQLAAISSVSMDFIEFHEISWISMDVTGLRFGDEIGQSLAPKESFTRTQRTATKLYRFQ